jgi:hypothetical protein
MSSSVSPDPWVHPVPADFQAAADGYRNFAASLPKTETAALLTAISGAVPQPLIAAATALVIEPPPSGRRNQHPGGWTIPNVMITDVLAQSALSPDAMRYVVRAAPGTHHLAELGTRPDTPGDVLDYLYLTGRAHPKPGDTRLSSRALRHAISGSGYRRGSTTQLTYAKAQAVFDPTVVSPDQAVILAAHHDFSADRQAQVMISIGQRPDGLDILLDIARSNHGGRSGGGARVRERALTVILALLGPTATTHPEPLVRAAVAQYADPALLADLVSDPDPAVARVASDRLVKAATS